MYEAIQAVSHILDLEQLLERIMDLIFRSLEADRGCLMLRKETPSADGFGASPRTDSSPPSSEEFEPKAVRWRNGVDRQEKIPVSRTIMDYVLREKQGILVSDATRDERFQSVQSVVRSGIREVICVPMRGRHDTLGVLYLDTSTPVNKLVGSNQISKFTGDHLALAIAIAHQAALAVEETRYYQAMVHAERLAAIGQTIAALSHHIKNILQGLRTGGEILEKGIQEKDEAYLQTGWKIVQKNQGKIYDLVMDMLSYSKEREPTIEPTKLNGVVRDVVELLQPRAAERGVRIEARLDNTLPLVAADPEGIHRAVLNILSNALDAVEEIENPSILVQTQREGADSKGEWVRIVVQDNGHGIAPEKVSEIFRPFVSTKGARGTGLGLAVSRKILREHGGDILVQSEVERGSTFTLRLPLRGLHGQDLHGTRTDFPALPPDAARP
jgi:signal transduction histidine kinase